MFFPSNPALDGAACATVTEEEKRAFFSRSSSNAPAIAKAICARCPVTAACLDMALEFEAMPGERRNGIWGGLTAGERSHLFGGEEDDAA